MEKLSGGFTFIHPVKYLSHCSICSTDRNVVRIVLFTLPRNAELLMNWFGFGFNGFGQIRANEKLTDGESAGDANVTYPISIDIVCRNLEEEPVQICQHNSNVDTQIRTSWSRRAALHSNSE